MTTKTTTRKTQKGDIVYCLIRQSYYIATTDIADEMNAGDPDWALICRAKDKRYADLLPSCINYKTKP